MNPLEHVYMKPSNFKTNLEAQLIYQAAHQSKEFINSTILYGPRWISQNFTQAKVQYHQKPQKYVKMLQKSFSKQLRSNGLLY